MIASIPHGSAIGGFSFRCPVMPRRGDSLWCGEFVNSSRVGLAILTIRGMLIAAAHANINFLTTDSKTAPIPSRGDKYRPLLMFLAAGLAAALLTLAFVVIGSEVAEGDTRGFDTQLLHFAQTLRVAHPGIAGVMRDLSGLGSTTVLTLFTLLAVSYLVMVSQRVTALLVASSVISGSILVSAFKSLYGRLRPDGTIADIVVPGMSFPSGHASMSAIVFRTLGALIASTRDSVAERAFIFATATLLTLLVGISRVVLGVHWTTDVIGGWAFGAGWGLLWLLLARYVAGRRLANQRTVGARHTT